MAALATASWRPFPLSAAPDPRSGTQKKMKEEDRGGASINVLRVLRRDEEFLRKRLRSATSALEPIRQRISDALGDLFWLRFLEDPRALHASRHPSSCSPKISYLPGLSGMDLLIADLEALKVYATHLANASKVWSVPLPEEYDPQLVADYFSCRPYLLAFRIMEVLFSFAFAAVKLRFSTSPKFSENDVEKTSFFLGGSEHYIGQLLKESLLNLGPTFIKVGQSLSTRPDIIGSEVSKALSELHDKVPPFPRAVAMKIIGEELGHNIEDTFSYISEDPIAAASFGQVYEGCTRDGFVVAIKVQRPNLLHVVVRDIYILRLGLAFWRKVAKRKNDPCLYADELGKGLVGELDYTLEAANASEFLEAHSCYSFMSVPRIYRHLTRKRVLTMEWVTGENPNDLLLLSKGSVHEDMGPFRRQQLEARTRLLDLVDKGVQASLVQLLETGLLHADPHPGNLRYTPDGRIAFLDFGLLCRMEKKHQLAMLASIVHIVNGDWGALIYDLAEMDVVRPGTNIYRVTMDLEEALDEIVFKNGIPNMKFSKVLGKIWSVALKYHFQMPPYYTLVLRSLASLEGLAVAADQNFKTFQVAYPYVIQKLIYDDSADTRRILYSVVFNKRREFQWDRIMLLFRLSSMRKGAEHINLSSTENISDNHVYEIGKFILKLLPSKDGVVLRRILISADPTSLARAFVSKEAVFFRQHVTLALTEAMVEGARGGKAPGQVTAKTQREREMAASSPATWISLLSTVLRDRRVKVILYRMLNGIKRDHVLMIRFYWTSFRIFMTVLALASHEAMILWSERFLRSVSFVPRQIAISMH